MVFNYFLIIILFVALLEGAESNITLNEIHSYIAQINPKEPSKGAIPFQANLMFKVNNTFVSFCGGSLIHPRWILTASHCLEQDNKPYAARLVFVTLGSVFTNGREGQTIQAERLFLNKLYFVSDGGYDIGLIKLKKNAVLGDNVKPVKLHINSSESLIGKTAYLTGYGITNDFYGPAYRLRKATLHIDTPNKCFLDPRSGYPEICCTSNLNEGKACKGDSGGPLTIKVNNTYIQVGITSRLSFIPICSIIINNSIYTRVSSYINWISKATMIDFKKYVPPS